MTWRDELERVTHPDGRKLIGGSFRGVPFFVARSERAGGGRTVVPHDLLGTDLNVVDDLGRRGKIFRLEAYVIGDDYIAQKNRLLSALEDVAGPGELIHPYWGRLRCICGEVAITESIEEGGIATFRLGFTHAPRTAGVTPVADPPSELREASTAGRAAAVASIASDYDVSSAPSYATATLENEISGRVDALILALPSGASTYLAANVVDDLASMVATPSELFSHISDAIEAGIVDDLRSLVYALLAGVNASSAAQALGDTAFREQERANQDALGNAIKLTLISEITDIMTDIEYTTLDDAEADVAAVAEAIDDLMLTASDDALEALHLLRKTLVRAVPGEYLPQLQTVEQRTVIPSLVLAYRLYGNVANEADLVARNSIRHPAFTSGTLSVIGN